MDNWLIWSLALFAAGLLITIVEVMLPSGGLLALAALACLVGSLYCAYQISGVAAAILVGVQAVCVPLVVVVTFKLLPKTSLGKRLMLTPPDESAAGPSKAATALPKYTELEALRGAEGVAATPLRPSGTAEFDRRRVSVVTNGELIPPGQRVRVVQVEGNRVVVEAVKQ